jgi:hypothetical protein
LLTLLISVAPNYTKQGKLNAEQLDDL